MSCRQASGALFNGLSTARAAPAEHRVRCSHASGRTSSPSAGERGPGGLLVGVNDGAVVPRSALIEAVASGAVRFPTITAYPDEAIVRRLGAVAIVVGRTGMSVTAPDGAGFTLGSRYTHVFTAGTDDGWRLISAQGTPIASAP